LPRPGRAADCGRRGALNRPTVAAAPLAISLHAEWPADAREVVDDGLDTYNAATGPMHQVRPLACVARGPQGQVLGGAMGRTWGLCAELQQLWVTETARGQGLGSQLLQGFEGEAERRGVQRFYLDTFSFQARGFYERHGYHVALTVAGYAPGVARHTMLREAAQTPTGPIAGVLIHVPDVAAALAWYQRLFPAAQRVRLDDPPFECLRYQQVQIELVPADAKGPAGPGGSVVYWRVPDLPAALDHARALGAPLYRGPMAIEDGLQMVQVRDPWGNCIGLRGPAPAAT